MLEENIKSKYNDGLKNVVKNYPDNENDKKSQSTINKPISSTFKNNTFLLKKNITIISSKDNLNINNNKNINENTNKINYNEDINKDNKKNDILEIKNLENEKKPVIIAGKWNFNFWISKLFLENSRLTFLLLLVLIFLGIFSLFNLKSTGFPNPTVPVVIVRTIYPGANSEVVNSEVTIPLEGKIKDVDGVIRYNSNSFNSLSVISVYLDEKKNVDSIKSSLDSVIKELKLPDGIENPKLETIDIGGPDVILSIVGKNIDQVYQKYQSVNKKLQENQDVVSVEMVRKIEKIVIVKPRFEELSRYGISFNEFNSFLSTFGENTPAVSNVTLDNTNISINTSVGNNTFEDLLNLTFIVKENNINNEQNINNINTLNKKTVKLKDIAEVSTSYKYDNNYGSVYGFYNKKENKEEVIPAIILNIKGGKTLDKGIFTTNLIEDLKEIDNINYVFRDDLVKEYQDDKVYLVKSYAVADNNQEQIDEIISGIIGSKIGDNYFGYLGYLLGGVQLVVLVMIAFVSIRAALIAAAAIPLSLLFTTIYLYFTGESLNTLVLFSLVLVLGLVVDPALVVLEAIQRKIDTGINKKDAVLLAIKDIGNGVFLATLTNIIVFVPFGILSGVFGQIFAYIPLTIVPAVIGSYIVPLVFLAWFGGITLKKNKNSKNDEAENMWQIAKIIVKINERILHSHRLIRSLIVILGLVIPISLMIFMFNSRAITQTQFSISDDADLGLLSGTFLPQISKENKENTTKKVLEILSKNSNITSVVEIPNNDLQYYVFFKPKDQREIKSKYIVEDINKKLEEEFNLSSKNLDKFFDLNFKLVQTGGQSSDYQINISVKTENLEKLKNSSQKIGKNIENIICFVNNEVIVDNNCDESKKIISKVDDGFTNKDNLSYNLNLDRDILLLSGMVDYTKGSLSNNLTFAIRNKFDNPRQLPVTQTVYTDSSKLDVYIKLEQNITTFDQLQNSLIQDFKVNQNQLDSLLKVKKESPKDNIQRIRGQTVGLIRAEVKSEFKDNQGLISEVTRKIIDFYEKNDYQETVNLGLEKKSINDYNDGSNADFQKSFSELFVALIIAVIASYVVLAVFFRSLSLPLTILYTIPLTILGVFPSLWFFAGGQFGFLEIIGFIILVGIVENVAIFLIDSANQKIKEGMEIKKAISYATGIRFKPIILTSITAIASLAPLAITSQFYRSISVVIMFGILSSSLFSLITTPILFVFFNWTSKNFQKLNLLNKILFYPLMPIYIIRWAILNKK